MNVSSSYAYLPSSTPSLSTTRSLTATPTRTPSTTTTLTATPTRASVTTTLVGPLAAGSYTYDALVINSAVTFSGRVTIRANSLSITSAGSLVGVGAGSPSSAGLGWDANVGVGNIYQGKGGTHGGCAQEVVNG